MSRARCDKEIEPQRGGRGKEGQEAFGTAKGAKQAKETNIVEEPNRKNQNGETPNRETPNREKPIPDKTGSSPRVTEKEPGGHNVGNHEPPVAPLPKAGGRSFRVWSPGI